MTRTDRLVTAIRARAHPSRSPPPIPLDEDGAVVLGRVRAATVPTSVPVLLAAAACGVVVALLGLWGWQRWEGRSSPPIDHQLPLLPVPPAHAPPVVADPDDAVASPGSVTFDNPVAQTDSAMAPALPVVVHVSGSVPEPGIVELPAAARVVDAIEAAGGANAAADLDRLNLAAPVADGARIHVPARGEDVAPLLLLPPVSASAGIDPGSEREPVDLNAADHGQLEALPGIGPSTAAAIVRTREQSGPYRSIDELLDVPGIGPAKLETLRPHVVVDAPFGP